METPILNKQQKVDAFFYISNLLYEMAEESRKEGDFDLSLKINKENKKVLSKISELVNNKTQN